MKRTVLLIGLCTALMFSAAQAIEKHEGYQVVQVESHSVAAVAADISPVALQVAREEYEGFAPMVSKTAVGFGVGASNTDRMRQSFAAAQDEPSSIASVTSPTKAPEDPGKHFS